MNKYGYHQDIIDCIVNIKSQESNSVYSYLIDKIQANKVEWQLIYAVIRQICEISIGYIQEYWNIFDQLYQFSKIKPKLYDDLYIIDVLFAKKYYINIKWNNKYKHFQTLKFDEILNYYESDPMMKSIIHDDIKSFKEIIDSKPFFDFYQLMFNKSLIENCCFCGAAECFKFLKSVGVEITKKCLDYSIDGRNKTIIDECLQRCKPDKWTMKEAIRIHNFDLAVSLEQKYGIVIDIEYVTMYSDIRLFFYLMSNAKTFDKFLRCGIPFKIPDLIDDILHLHH